jgi:hypothetical protein
VSPLVLDGDWLSEIDRIGLLDNSTSSKSSASRNTVLYFSSLFNSKDVA